MADQYIRAGTYKKILFCAAEVQSHNLDYSDAGRDMAVLFGDGGAADVVEANESDDGRGILSTHLFSDGRFASDLWMENPSSAKKPIFSKDMFERNESFARMDGKNVFKNASERMPEAVMAALERNGLSVADIALPIPHQANARMLQQVAKRLDVPFEKVYLTIEKYGNISSPTIPIARARRKLLSHS